MKHKSMFRRLLSVLLCLTMVFSLLPTSALAEGLEEPVAEPETQPEQADNGSFNLKIDFVSQDGTALAEAYEASAAQGAAWEGTVPFVAVDGYRPAKVEFGKAEAANAPGEEGVVSVYGECANVQVTGEGLVLSGAAEADVHVIVTYLEQPAEEQPAAAEGSVTITYTHCDRTEWHLKHNSNGEETIEITVKAVPLTGLTVSGSKIVMSGNTVQLSAAVTPANAKKNLTWSSSDTSVLTVDQNGVVTGVSKGEATVTVTDSLTGVSADYTVSVLNQGDLGSITVSGPNRMGVGTKNKIQLTATTEPANDDAVLTWTSGDTSVLTVDQNGVVTGVKAGTATVTVSAEGYVPATHQITVAAGSWVFVYTQVVGDTTGLVTNADGWYTLGKVFIPDLGEATSDEITNARTATAAQEKAVINAVMSGDFIRYEKNQGISIDKVNFNRQGRYGTFGLHKANGAADYNDDPEIAKNPAWHLDGTVDVEFLGSIVYRYYNDQGKKLVDDTVETASVGTTISKTAANAPSVDAYAFKGIAVSKNENPIPTDGNASVSFAVEHATHYVTFIYTLKTYTVTYTDGVDGEEVFADQVTEAFHGDPTPAFNNGTNPTREGYKFVGWTPAVADTVTANATYTAQWEKNVFDITYSYTGTVPAGAPDVPVTAKGTYGESYSVAEVPSLPGYTLSGWTTNDVTVTYGKFTMPANDVAFTGSWSENAPVTIKYVANDGGTVSPASENVAPATGEAAGSTATAADDYYFVNWTDSENNVVSTDAKFVPGKNADGIYEAATYTAHFAPKNVVNVTITGATASGVYNATAYTADGFTVNGDLPEGVTITLKEGVTAQASRTDAGTTNMGLTADSFNINNVPYDTKVVITDVTDGYVTITKRPVTVTGDGWADDQLYTGTEYSKDTYTFNNVVADQTASITYSIAGTEVGKYTGTFGEDFKVMSGENEVTANYELTTKTPGTLTIVKSAIADYVTLKTADAEKTYDGTALVAGTATALDKNGKTVKVEYQKADGTWTEDPADITATDVADSKTVNVRASVEGSYDGYVTGTQQLTITKRPVTVTTESGSKVYDGTALTAPGEVKGIVEGETYTFTVTGTQTIAGDSDNTYTMAFDGTAKENNYTISEALGTLTVTNRTEKYEITVVANSRTDTYDGNEKRVSGLETLTFTVNGQTYTVEGLSASAAGTDAGTYTAAVTGTAVVKDVKGNDVTNQFEVNTTNGTLTINKRSVTLTSESGSKAYDGTALTKPDVAMTGDGFVEGEVTGIKATGSVTNVAEGEVTNTITFTAGEKFNVDNYSITKNEGTLTITPIETEYVIKVSGKTDTVTYNGKEQSVTGYTVSDYDSSITLTGPAQDAAIAKGTNVSTYEMGLKAEDFSASSDNYTNIRVEVEDGWLKITNASIVAKFTGESKSVTYNGKEQEITGITAEGLLEGHEYENLSYSAKGTDADTYNGVFSGVVKIVDANGTDVTKNYAVETVPGTLTITPVTDEVTVTITGNNDSQVYDGKAHDVTGYKVSISNPLYTEGDFSFSGTASASGTNVDTYKMGLSADMFANTSKNFSKVTFNVTDGYVTITKRSVTVTGDGWADDQLYTGKEYKKDTYTFANVVDGQTASITYSISGTGVGSYTGTFGDDFVVMSGEDEVTANYELTTKTPGTLNIVKSAIAQYVTLTPKDVEETYDGNTYTAAAANATDSNDNTVKVEYSVNGTEWTEDPSTITATNVADSVTVNVRASVEGSYTGYVTGTQKLTINPRNVTLTSATDSKPYDGTPLTRPDVAVTGDGFVDGEVTDIKATGSVTTVADGVVTNTITYTASGNFKAENYEISISEGTLTITAIANEIVITANSNNKTYDGTPLTDNGYSYTKNVLAEGDVLTAVVEGSQTDAGSSENVVTSYMVMRGETDVTANYTISTKNGTLTVTAKEVTVTADNKSKVYGEKDPELTATVTGLVEGESLDLITYDVTRATGENVGDYTITPAGEATQGNYTVTYKTGTLTITAKTIKPDPENPNGISVNDPKDHTYDGAEHKFVPEVKDGETVLLEDTDYTVTYDTKNFTDVNGTITVTVTGKGNYQGEVTRTYKILPREVNLTSESAIKVYDGTPLTRPEVTGGDSFVAGEVSDLTATGSITEVGSVANTITYTEGESFKADNYNITKDEGTLTIVAQSIDPEDPREPDPENPDQPVYGGVKVGTLTDEVYNGQSWEKKPTVTDKDGNALVEGTDYTLAWSADTVNVGTVTVTVTGIGSYTGSVTRTYEITKRPVALSSAADSKVYDGTALTRPDVTVTGDGFVTGEVTDIKATGSVTNVAEGEVTNAITYTESESFNANNYEITKNEGKLSIKPAAVTVTADNKTKTFGTNDPELTAAVTGLVGEDTVAYTLSRVEGETVGEYTITPAGDAAQGNYTVTYATGTLTITAQSINPVDPENPDPNYNGVEVGTLTDEVYNGQSWEKKPTVTDKDGNALVEGTDYTLAWSADTVNVGTVTVTVTGIGSYTGSVERTYRITPATVIVTADSKAKTFNTADPALTATVTGLIGTDTVEYTLARAAGEAVGNYTITPAGDAAQGNYKVTYVPGTLTITAQSINPVDPENPDPNYNGVEIGNLADVVYNGESQAQKPTVTDKDGYALVEGTDYTVTFSEDTTNVGKVTVTVTGIGNYAGTVERTYRITPATVIVTADSKAKTFNSADPALTATVTGLIGTDTVEYTLARAAGEDVGNYAITAAGAETQGNYIVRFVPGTMVITGFIDDPPVVDIPELPPLPEAIDDELTPLDGPQVTVDDPVNIDDEATPLAGEHECCILHFLILCAALLIELLYINDKKKRQQKIFEMRRELNK